MTRPGKEERKKGEKEEERRLETMLIQHMYLRIELKKISLYKKLLLQDK